MDFSKIKIALIALAVGLVAGAGTFALATMHGPDQGGDGGGVERSALANALDAPVYTGQGDAVSIEDIAGGRPLLIDFWATWCPFCTDDLPELEKLRARYGDRVAFAYIDMSDGERETAGDAVAWLAQNGYDGLPVFFDNDAAAGKAFELEYLPTVVLVSSDGGIEAVFEESIDPSAVAELLESLS